MDAADCPSLCDATQYRIQFASPPKRNILSQTLIRKLVFSTKERIIHPKLRSTVKT